MAALAEASDQITSAPLPDKAEDGAGGAPEEMIQTVDCPTVELQQFAHAIDAALRAEEVSSEEPESEEAGGHNSALLTDEATVDESAIAEACLKRLRGGLVSSAALEPLLEASGMASPPPALKQLPSTLEELVGLLGKSWQLAHTRGERRREISRRLAASQVEAEAQRERASRAEAARATAEADAGHGEKAHEMLEGTLARLTAARKTVKEREWELRTAKTKLETLEEDNVRQNARVRALETALERSTSTRIEASSQAATTLASTEASLANAEASREELQRRLSVAEVAADEARAFCDRRVEDVESRLAESHSTVEDLQRRLQELEEAASAARAVKAAEESRRSGGGSGAYGEAIDAGAGAGEDEVPSLPTSPAAASAGMTVPPLAVGRPPAVPGVGAIGGLGGLSALREQEQHVEGVGILAPTPRTGLRNSLSTRGGVETASSSSSSSRPAAGHGASPAAIVAPGGVKASSRLTSPARIVAAQGGDRRGTQTTPARQGRRSVSGASGSQLDAHQQAPSMPMDLRALGNILTGGGLLGKKGGKK